jgi:cell division protein FtsB
MAPARSAQARAARRPANARGATVRPRVVRGGGARATGIRWDRVGRVALLVVLFGIVLLYAGPARSYFATVHEAQQRHAELAKLQRENARLRARRTELESPAALEREARRLGMVKPGERPYVVENLPQGR